MAQALAPMHARGRVIGILSAISYQPYNFSTAELIVLGSIAHEVGVALDNARLFGEVVSSENRLWAILESTADAVLAVDTEHRVVIFNNSAQALFAMELDQVIGVAADRTDLPEQLLRGLDEAPRQRDSA